MMHPGNLAGKPPLGLKVEKTPKPRRKPLKARRRTASQADRDHMARIAALPCVCCGYWPVHVHHCIHDRFSQARASDRETIPLCARCHAALHADKTAWRAEYGPDHDYLPIVADMLAGEWVNPWGTT